MAVAGCSYGTRSPLQYLTRIIDFTFRFPMRHGSVRHRRFHGNCSAAGIRIFVGLRKGGSPRAKGAQLAPSGNTSTNVRVSSGKVLARERCLCISASRPLTSVRCGRPGGGGAARPGAGAHVRRGALLRDHRRHFLRRGRGVYMVKPLVELCGGCMMVLKGSSSRSAALSQA